jgi:hypothetical protein
MNKFLALCAITLLATSATAAEPNNANAEIIKLVKVGMPESIVIAKIDELRRSLDTSADALITLKESGASDAILTAFVLEPAPKKLEARAEQIRNRRFSYNQVSLTSFKSLPTEYRLTLELKNQGNVVHEFLSGTSVSANPLPSSCEQAILTDQLGNSFECSGASIPLDPDGYNNARGIQAAPGDSVLVTYTFGKRSTDATDSKFTFLAKPMVLFNHTGMFIATGTQTSAELAIEFDDLIPE